MYVHIQYVQVICTACILNRWFSKQPNGSSILFSAKSFLVDFCRLVESIPSSSYLVERWSPSISQKFINIFWFDIINATFTLKSSFYIKIKVKNIYNYIIFRKKSVDFLIISGLEAPLVKILYYLRVLYVSDLHGHSSVTEPAQQHRKP